ncbi:MAG TPA: right-handed parallel beta-helix repeat-containing protein [Verrucomicrobiae bacterium]|jgi:parallel beta-helix repeat protein
MKLTSFLPQLIAVQLLTLAGNTTFAQGSLTPPGAPAPLFKTLTQVEPRTPISALPFTISQPGSYYLTTNLTGNPGGITISNSNVTIDLMGFALVGGTGGGIVVSGGRTNIAIRNGTVHGWGANGIDAINAHNSQFEALRVSRNGGSGISAGPGSAVKGCTTLSNSTDGVHADFGCTISGCTAVDNGGNGIYANHGGTVSGCTALGNASDGIEVKEGTAVSGCAARLNAGDGIFASDGNTISGCTASQNGGRGIFADAESTISGCSAYNNDGDGIQVRVSCIVLDNICNGNGFNGDGAGIHVIERRNRIDGNTVISNDRGIDVDLGSNLIIRNSAGGNTINYDIVGDNRYGPIVDIAAVGTAAVSGNSAPSTLTTTDPWANFRY